MQIFSSKYIPFWLMSLAIGIILVVPHLIQEGMFMDGNLYLSVAKNLSLGIGTFWNPIFSDSWEIAGRNTFHEQPPLFFGIEALWFKIFGYGLLVERFFSLFTAFVTAFIINKIWKSTNKDQPEFYKVNWIPFLYWVSIPLVFWAFHNNVIENTLSIFTLLSVFFIIKFHEKSNYIYLLLAGCIIFAASLTKGVPGLFPLSTIGIYWLVYRKNSLLRTIMDTLLLSGIVVIIYVIILFTSDVAFDSLEFYFQKRLLGRINNDPTVNSRFWVLARIIGDIAPMMGLSLLFFFIGKWKKTSFTINKNHVLFFLLLGIAGSVPLMLTMVQKGFYFVPALPYFALAFAFISAPPLLSFIHKINIKAKGFKIFTALVLIGFIGSIGYSITQVGGTNQDQDTLNDVRLIGTKVPHFSSIKTDNSVYFNWGLQTYFMRYYNICLDPNMDSSCYILKKKNEKPEENYILINLETRQYDLYINENCQTTSTE